MTLTLLCSAILPLALALAGDPSVVESLATHLAAHGLEAVEAQPFAATPLTRAEAEKAKELLWQAHAKRVRSERAAEIEARELKIGDASLRFVAKTFGEAPAAGRSLWISMHGGGGAPAAVNDQQWKNQQRLYELDEGLYVAPRAPGDSWDLWHRPEVDALFDRLIADLIVLEGVDSDRVYLLGYSAGGDGAYQLGPRMADRFAAVAMMAGHPNDAKPDSLRNVAFALHVGADDAAFDRNKVAAEWKDRLAELAAADPIPGGYVHQVEIHAGKGHWMDRDDRAALPWMAAAKRDLRASRIVWLQDDVAHARSYWLAVDEPAPRSRVVVEREGQRVHVVEATGVAALRIRLDDAMLDLDSEVVVTSGERDLFRGRVPRTVATLARTLAERGDPRGTWSAELSVVLDG